MIEIHVPLRRLAALISFGVALIASPSWSADKPSKAETDESLYAETLKVLHPAAEKGDADAQFQLGLIYDQGQGVPIDPEQAAVWFTKLAEQGHVGAQHALGTYYELGKGVQQDDAQAVKWFEAAAQQGDARAIRNLGNFYLEGRGVAADPKRAAEQGFAKGKLLLGRMLARGEGTKQNLGDAWFWLLVAEAQEPVLARHYMKEFSGQISKAERADAEARASAWMPGD